MVKGASKLLGAWVLIFYSDSSLVAQRNRDNYISREEQVAAYELKDLFPKEVSDKSQAEKKAYWETKRRPEILELYSQILFGKTPLIAAQLQVNSKVIEKGKTALYKREQCLLTLKNSKGDTLNIRVLLFLPNNKKPLKGLCIGLNFLGNHTTTLDPEILLSPSFAEWNNEALARDFRQSEASRGVRQHRWPIHLMLEKGFGLITSCYQDWEPDKAELPKSVAPYGLRQLTQSKNEWGAIGAWALGYQILCNWALEQKRFEELPVYVSGHSRLGKAALWASAQNERISGALISGSGRCGASLFKRRFGEPLQVIGQNFPHWFLPNIGNLNVDSLPFDQHFLMACVAPRKLMVASASNDWWADPKGEYLSLLKANPVFRLYSEDTLPNVEPKIERILKGSNQFYHLRRGDHDITYLEWEQFLKQL